MSEKPHLRKPDAGSVRQEWDTITENGLRLDEEVAAEIVDALNDDISGFYILFNQIRKHYWIAEGAEWNDLSAFLEDAAERLTEITDAFAIRVHALGGVPVCGPMGIRQHAPLYIESEHHYDMRSSLDRDLDGYATLAVQIRDHVEMTKTYGDQATNELLRENLKTLEQDAHVLQRYLADDTLTQQ